LTNQRRAFETSATTHRRRRPGQVGSAARAIPDSPSVRGANKERAALPVTSDKKGALSIARRRKR